MRTVLCLCPKYFMFTDWINSSPHLDVKRINLILKRVDTSSGLALIWIGNPEEMKGYDRHTTEYFEVVPRNVWDVPYWSQVDQVLKERGLARYTSI